MERNELIGALKDAEYSDDQIEEIMELVDAYVVDLTEEPPEAWTALEIARYLGLANADSARATMSAWGVKSIAVTEHPTSKRPVALYPAGRIIEEHTKRSVK